MLQQKCQSFSSIFGTTEWPRVYFRFKKRLESSGRDRSEKWRLRVNTTNRYGGYALTSFQDGNHTGNPTGHNFVYDKLHALNKVITTNRSWDAMANNDVAVNIPTHYLDNYNPHTPIPLHTHAPPPHARARTLVHATHQK